MNGHHLVLGKIVDVVTGQTLIDTHDERYRQKVARLLIERKGYGKTDIIPRIRLQAQAGEKQAIVKIDFGIALAGKLRMIIKYGPGSLVTRRRPALSASRLVAPFQVPVVVVTNGETAEVLDGYRGALLSTGLDSIPSRSALEQVLERSPNEPISPERAEKESRILYAYEVDDSCPCDDTICRL